MPRLALCFPSFSRVLLLAGAGVLAPGLGGCVSQQEYDKLSSANRALEERNVLLQQEAESRDAAMNLLKERIARGDAALNEASGRNASLNSDMLGMKDSYRGLSERLDGVSRGVLDPQVDAALRKLAAEHPELIKYDAGRGMVQFAADLTFASGSVEVKPEARQSLEQFARILASTAGGQYDVRIVGHTDNVPVSRPETRSKHPNNTYLSAHRAIAVRDVLQSMGMAAERMEVAGWGQYRPVVANPSSGGAAPNRRVEIFLVASSRSGPVDSAEAEARPAAKAPTETPMK